MVAILSTPTGVDERSILRIYANSEVPVEDIRAYFYDLEFAYNCVFLLDHIVAKAVAMAQHDRYQCRYSFWNIFSHIWPPNPDLVSSLIPANEKLIFRSAVFQSPGFWEFLGSLNPLEVIREYLNDRHERRKDREYREEAEKRKLFLENELLLNRIAGERVEILKSLDIPPIEISLVMQGLLLHPLGNLNEYQDRELIAVADLRPITEVNEYS
jgi:hypothetical protein